MPSRSARSKNSRLLLFVIVAALGWAAWKVVTGGGGGPDPEQLAFRPLPYVNYGLKPSFTRRSERVLTSNALGYRGEEIEQPKPAGRFRILCLGGSTTYTSFTDDDATYPARLEAHLREARPDLDIEVVNGGVESYTSAESLANLAYRGLDLEPDMVVVYHAANDYRVRRYPDFDGGYTPYRRVWDGGTDDYEPGEGERAGGINVLVQHAPRAGGPSEEENARRHGAAVFRRNLLSIVGLARTHGIRPVLVTFATSDAACASPDLVRGVDEHNDVIRALCAEQSVPCIDFAPRMEQRAELWADCVHVTTEGADLKARLVAEELVGLLP